MTLGFFFWLLMILWIVIGWYFNRAAVGPWLKQGDWLIFVLLAILGIAEFGWPIKT